MKSLDGVRPPERHYHRLSPVQEQLLELIRKQDITQMTNPEIAFLLGLTNKQSVVHALAKLVKLGYLVPKEKKGESNGSGI